MKKLILTAALIGLAGIASAQVNVGRVENGSGQPNSTGFEGATKWDNNIYHAPQYMPGYPTAATLFPRVVEVKCKQAGNAVNCTGYNWLPEMGRGEYLMIQPTIVQEPKPTVVTNTVIKEVLVPVPLPVVTKKIKE